MSLDSGSAQNIGSRASQQDAFGFSDAGNADFVSHAGVLAVLADGMGGMANGGAASAAAVRAFLASYAAKLSDEEVSHALLRAFHAANAAVLDVARLAGTATGTTLLAAVVHRHALYWVSSGDSRLYKWRDGQASQLTRDHVYWRELEEHVAAGRVEASDAEMDPQRNSLTSHLGRISPVVDRPQKPLPLRAGDLVLLCSDGLYGVLSDAEIAAAAGAAPQQVCEELLRRVLQRARPDQDNVTVLGLGSPQEAPRSSNRLVWAAVLLALLTAAVLCCLSHAS